MITDDIINRSSVLIVDDNPNNLEVLGGFLQKEGMDVEFALDGKTAFNWLETRSFDLILLDIMMPVMDGFEICQIIKNNPALVDVPVIFITAKTDTGSIIKGFELGAVDYITKPFIQRELLARVRSHIHIKKSNEKLRIYLNKIEVQNKNIRDSIEYARNIQKAVLNTTAQKVLVTPVNFKFHLPKDIVSGDFYWYHESEDECIHAVMDCTGHGVPGAFMSILGVTLLNKIVIHDNITSPEQILEHLRTELINTLVQDYDKIKIKDGMDGSIIRYNLKTRILDFSGAFNPLIYFHEDRLIKINADRIPVGYYEKILKFTLKTVKMDKGDIVYLFSDGYYDQFGEKENRKINKCRFMDLLTRIHNLTLDNQKSELLDFLYKWKGNLEQTDDILIVGLRF